MITYKIIKLFLIIVKLIYIKEITMAERKLMVRQQVREINRKLFANDLILEDSNQIMINEIIASILQNISLDEDVYKVPTILQVENDLLNKETLDKIMMVDKNSLFVEVNSSVFEHRDKTDIVKYLKNEGYKIIVRINKTDTVFTLVSILADIIKIDIKVQDEDQRRNWQNLVADLTLDFAMQMRPKLRLAKHRHQILHQLG